MVATQANPFQEQNLRMIASNIMRRYIISLFTLFLFVPIYANKMSERRVYYLDCSYSMKTSKIWDDVCDNLIKAIENVEDETTELLVIPFAVDGSHHQLLNAFCEKATPIGKANLKEKIQKISPSTKSMTYHSDPIKDFYNNNRVAGERITYMFLMTDGQNEEKPDLFKPELRKWGAKFGTKDVYGFYVMLNGAARNTDVESIIDQESHFWNVNTADVDINLLRLQNNCTYNVRNDEYVDVPISEKLKNIKITLTTQNQYYRLNRQIQADDYIRLYLDYSDCYNQATLPEEEVITCSVQSTGCGEFDFLLTDKIQIVCQNKKVKGIRPTFNKGKKIEKLGKVIYYPKFWWSDEKTISLTDTLFLNFNHDAKENHAYAEFRFVDSDGNAISQEDLHIHINGEKIDKHLFRIDSKDDFIVLTFCYTPSAEAGKYQGWLQLKDHNLNQSGDTELVQGQKHNSLYWQIQYEKDMNPLAKCMMWIGIIILTLLLLWFLVIKPIKYPTFKTYRKNILISKAGKIQTQHKVTFTGARKVIFANKVQQQSTLNKIFCGKIVTYVNADFESPISFTPTRNRKAAHAVGHSYNITPNPIQRSGIATIINQQKQLKITLN